MIDLVAFESAWNAANSPVLPNESDGAFHARQSARIVVLQQMPYLLAEIEAHRQAARAAARQTNAA